MRPAHSPYRPERREEARSQRLRSAQHDKSDKPRSTVYERSALWFRDQAAMRM